MILDDKVMKRFWKNVDKKTNDECWEWRQTSYKRRYGRMRVQGKETAAHRISYTYHRGKIPKGLFICHKCNNTRCVNPNHLYAGTHSDNMKDREKAGTSITTYIGDKNIHRGEAHPRTKFKNQDIRNIRQLYKNGMSQTAIAILYKVTLGAINPICKHKNWSHIK